MSYIRAGHPLKYVEGESEDYVYCDGQRIVDYGGISDTGFIEMLFDHWQTEDKYNEMFKNHFIKRLAERLGVKLRKKPLTDKQLENLYMKMLKKWRGKTK